MEDSFNFTQAKMNCQFLLKYASRRSVNSPGNLNFFGYYAGVERCAKLTLKICSDYCANVLAIVVLEVGSSLKTTFSLAARSRSKHLCGQLNFNFFII